MNDIHSIPVLLIFKIALDVAVIIFIFWFIQAYLTRWIKDDYWYHQIMFYNPVLRNIIWILYSCYIIYLVIEINQFFGLLIALFILVLMWTSIKNLFYGIIYKIQTGNVIGQQVNLKEHSGKISALRNTKVDLELDNGQIIQYPYHVFFKDVTSSPEYGNLKKVSVLLDMKIKEIDLKQIERSILSNPYVVAPEKLVIEIIDDNSSNKKLKIILFTAHQKYISRVTKFLKLFENK